MNLLNRRSLTGGTLAVLAVLFIALVMLSSLLLRGARLDLTDNSLFTLSEGTEAILSKIDEPVQLYFFFSDRTAQNIPQLRSYGTRVRELLEEMVAKSGGNLKLEVIDPLPFSEAEDRATAFGLQAVPLGSGGESLVFGLAGTNSTDGQAIIPFFQPSKESFLEYDIAKLISSLTTLDKPVLGIMSSLPIAPRFDPASGAPAEGWVLDSELAALFEIRRLEITEGTIPDDVQVLMLVHPKSLSLETEYAVDQFVMRGGRLVLFVDPNAETEPAPEGVDQMQALFSPRASELDRLLTAWGVKFDPERVVLDAKHALQVQGGSAQRPMRHLGILGLDQDSLNQQDVVSAQLGTVNFSTVGYFEAIEGAETRLEALAQSSEASMSVAAEKIRFLPDPSTLLNDFAPSGEPFVLAGRLTGILKSAFPERSGDSHLSETKEPANIILFADTDVLADRLWVQVQQFFGQRMVNAFADNGNLVINSVDNLVGSADLIAVRTRATSSRPFTRVEELKRLADDRFRLKEQELQQELAETERNLTELQGGKDQEQAMVLSAEQRAELERFQQEKIRIRAELRQVRRQLDADIESLGAKLKFINIAGMPIALTLGVLGLLFWRSRRRQPAVARR